MVPAPNPKHAEKRKDKASRPSKRNGKPNFAGPSKDSISINATKSKIRDVKRVLEHALDLPSGVRIEKERALAGYRQDLEKAVEDKKRNDFIGRYHMVRFFERRKAERALKKARAQLAAAANADGEIGQHERVELRQKVHLAEVDVNYAIYHPLTEKYVSLFPKTGGSNHVDEEADSTRPPIWSFVEQCMVSGTLDMLRDGKYGVRSDGSVKTREDLAPQIHMNAAAEKKKQQTTRTNIARNGAQAGDESDGGFFEE